MNPVLTVFLKEFRENLRDRRTLMSALILGPLLGPMLFAAALSLNIEQGTVKGDRPVPLAVSHADRAPNLLAFLHEYGVDVKRVDADDAGARSNFCSPGDVSGNAAAIALAFNRALTVLHALCSGAG